MSKDIKYDEDKLRELMLYVALQCEGQPKFGAVKLNKILFYADFSAYARYGKPITGAEYRHLERGPGPRRLVPVREKLEAEQAAFVRPIPTYFGRPQQRLMAMRMPDLTKFSAEEISLVDSVIRDLWDDSADEVSQKSHEHPGWLLALDGETIPYEAALLPKTPIPLTKKESDFGLGLLRENM